MEFGLYEWRGVAMCAVQLSSRRRREDSAGGQSTSESEADSDFEPMVSVAIFGVSNFSGKKCVNFDKSGNSETVGGRSQERKRSFGGRIRVEEKSRDLSCRGGREELTFRRNS